MRVGYSAGNATVLVDGDVGEHRMCGVHTAVDQPDPRDRGDPVDISRCGDNRSRPSDNAPTASIDVIEIKLGGRRERSQPIEGAERIHFGRRTEHHYPRVEPFELAGSQNRETRAEGRVQGGLVRRYRENLPADNRRPVTIRLDHRTIAPDEVSNREPAHILKLLQVRSGVVHHSGSQRNLWQHRKAHIRQSDLRLGHRDQYHQQNERRPHHGRQSRSAHRAREETCITVRITDTSRMPTAIDDLGEQIVQLLPRLRRFARSLANNVQDADDLVQLAVERALSRSDQLRPGARLASWMFGILRNAWIDEARAKGRRTRLFAPEELGENVADPAADGQADALSVQDAMARLPVEQREVIGLVLVEGLSYKEAADIIGVPIGTITSRLARGRDALQTLLGAAA